MNARLLSSVFSVFVLLFSANSVSGQSNLLFTFEDSGPDAIATVTGSFDTSGLNLSGQLPTSLPGGFLGAATTVTTLGTTTAATADIFGLANFFGPPSGFSYIDRFALANVNLTTPLSEYLQISGLQFGGPGSVGLAQGQTIFDANALSNNVLVYQNNSISSLGFDNSFLSTTPLTVLSDPSGENTIQLVLAVPEPTSTALLLAGSAGIALLRRRK